MATLTSTAIASGVQPKALHAGLQAVHVFFNAAATVISASATTIFMAKIPHGAKVYDVQCYETDGAATKATTDLGRVGALNAFGSGAGGAVFRATGGVPYSVSATATGYEIFTATCTATTATTSVKVSMSVYYDMSDVEGKTTGE